jgi:hypothetical protein
VRYCLKKPNKAGHQWLMPVILPTQEAEIRRITVRSLANSSMRPYLKEKTITNVGLVVWLKVKAPNSSPSTAKKKKKKPKNK